MLVYFKCADLQSYVSMVKLTKPSKELKPRMRHLKKDINILLISDKYNLKMHKEQLKVIAPILRPRLPLNSGTC